DELDCGAKSAPDKIPLKTDPIFTRDKDREADQAGGNSQSREGDLDVIHAASVQGRTLPDSQMYRVPPSAAACSATCVTMITVSPSATSLRTSSITRIPMAGSSAEVGSSRRSTSGAFASARASATL